MTSTHTSFAAARAPARSPLAALLQIPSTFAFTLAESVGARWITLWHWATICCTARPLAPPAEVVLAGVDAVPVAAEPVDGVLAVLAGVTGVLAAGVELVWLEDVVLLLLPQPASNAAPATATASHVDSFQFISHPNRRKNASQIAAGAVGAICSSTLQARSDRGGPHSRATVCAFFAFGFLEGLFFSGFFAFKPLLCGFLRGLFGSV